MKKVVAINGSPRKNGNTSFLLDAFLQGFQFSVNSEQLSASQQEVGNEWVKNYCTNDIKIKHCTGCLRCNILRRCSLRDDDWEGLSQEILEADVLVFASPIYFHHVTAPMKTIIDRFRSFVHVQITENGIKHTPHQLWNKDFVLLLPMG